MMNLINYVEDKYSKTYTHLLSKQEIELADKINQILINNDIDQNTIDVLSLTSLWEISDDEDALAFNLYLLRHLKDQYLEPNFANVISLSVIAKKVKNEWVITIVNALFDKDLRAKINEVKDLDKYINILPKSIKINADV